MTATKYQKQGRAVSLAQQWTASRALDHLEGRLSFDDLTPASQRMVREMHPDAVRRMAETDVTRLPNYGKPRFEPGSRAYKKWKKRKQRNGEWVSYTQPKVIPIKQWRRKFRHNAFGEKSSLSLKKVSHFLRAAQPMNVVATTMDTEQLDFLRKQDWEDIAVKLTDWSIWCAQLFGWPEKLLPLGKTPEDMAYDVIHAFWNEDNTYNPKWGLMTQLKRAVRRNYSNLFRLESVKKTSLFDEDDPPDAMDETPTPEEAASIQNEFDRAIQALLEHPKVQRSEDLQLVVTAYGCGFWDEADLARETGLKIERIYQLNRELKDIYPSIKKTTSAGERSLPMKPKNTPLEKLEQALASHGNETKEQTITNLKAKGINTDALIAKVRATVQKGYSTKLKAMAEREQHE